MLIYFDESYDNNHYYLLLGALFSLHPRYLHRKLLEIKKKNNYFEQDGSLKEIKYNDCYRKEDFTVAREAIDAFMESTSWYRCIAIDQKNKMDLHYFGRPFESDPIKKARAYKKFAELLIKHNTENIYNGVLLTDNIKRCNGDEFIERMKEIFCVPLKYHSSGKFHPTLKHIAEVSSKLEQYQVLQICDLLTGCVLNNLFPTKNFYKNEIRKYLVQLVKVDSLLPKDWNRYSKTFAEEYYPKFNIWYWKPAK